MPLEVLACQEMETKCTCGVGVGVGVGLGVGVGVAVGVGVGPGLPGVCIVDAVPPPHPESNPNKTVKKNKRVQRFQAIIVRHRLPSSALA